MSFVLQNDVRWNTFLYVLNACNLMATPEYFTSDILKPTSLHSKKDFPVQVGKITR